MTWSKASRQSRGYDAQWQRTRLLVLQRDNGLCQCDQCRGGDLRLTVANEVHHITSKAKAKALGWTRAQTDEPSNLQAVAHACHERLSATAQGRPLKPKQCFDARGYPIADGTNQRGGPSESFEPTSRDRSEVSRVLPHFNIPDTE